MFVRPTASNIEGSFESWAYRRGLGRRLAELERQKLIEQRHGPNALERVYRLTAAGRMVALRGVDPVARWRRPWDGKWRFVLFDLPEQKNDERVRLRRQLRRLRFGHLQHSVWISPDSLEAIRSELTGAEIDVESLTLIEGCAAGGESDQDLVNGAWDFELINGLYRKWRRIAANVASLGSAPPAESVRTWAALEREAWNRAAMRDPFLPQTLLPADYAGRKAWDERVAVLSQFRQLLAPSVHR